MKTRKSKIFPILITILLIVIIIYLFATVKQPFIECTKTTTFDSNIKVKEDLKASLNNNKISKIDLTKTIILPDDLIKDSKHMNSIEYALKESYDYLGKNNVMLRKEDNKIIMKISIEKDETVILNNIEFTNNNELQIKVDSNTKSSNVVALKIADKYTEGELMTRMKNNGYACK